MLGPGKPYGVDLLLPQVGAGARATNKDYTGGALGELVQVMVDEQVSALLLPLLGARRLRPGVVAQRSSRSAASVSSSYQLTDPPPPRSSSGSLHPGRLFGPGPALR